IAAAGRHWGHPRARFAVADIEGPLPAGEHDVVVAFEVLEHLEHPERALAALAPVTRHLLASVPNQAVLPFDKGRFPWHVRHYTAAELVALLEGSGWRVTTLCSQPSR